MQWKKMRADHNIGYTTRQKRCTDIIQNSPSSRNELVNGVQNHRKEIDSIHVLANTQLC